MDLAHVLVLFFSKYIVAVIYVFFPFIYNRLSVCIFSFVSCGELGMSRSNFYSSEHILSHRM